MYPHNSHATALPSKVRTATTTSIAQRNDYARGGHFRLDVTAAAGGGETVTVTIQGSADGGTTWYDLLVGAAQTATGTYIYKIYPGLPATANLVANDVLPDVYRVQVAHSAGGNWTYTLSQTLVV